jgi:hypothetical protein
LGGILNQRDPEKSRQTQGGVFLGGGFFGQIPICPNRAFFRLKN